MSNFSFLAQEYQPLMQAALGAEQLVHADPRASLMRNRHALEQLLHWLYTHDRELFMPYDRSLNALLSHQDLQKIVPQRIMDKMRLIQRVGNQAVHGQVNIQVSDAMHLIRELFHVFYWFARKYTLSSSAASLADLTFQESAVPRLISMQDAVRLTREQLKKQADQLQGDMAQQHEALEKREAEIAAQAATLAERERLLAQIDAELAQKRAELAQAKLENSKLPDTHNYNEADTRKYIIDLLLREAGWEVGKNAKVEVPVQDMPSPSGAGAVDYVLYGDDGKALAIIEAKRSMAGPEQGQQQAKLYADSLEKQTGFRPVIFYTNGHTTMLWDDLRAPPRQVQGFYTAKELQLTISRRAQNQQGSSLSDLTVNAAIVERAYQVRAIRAMSNAFERGDRAGLLIMATGTGKTRTAIALVDVLMQANMVQRVLFLADRTSLVNQATNAFKAHLPKSSPVNLVTEKSGQGRVYLCTYQSMIGLIDQINEDGTRKYGIGHFDLIIIDEAHRSVYQKYGVIFKYFDSLLMGLTATPRDEVDRDTYHLFNLPTGVPTDVYGLEDAIKDGYLVPPKAHSVPLRFVREGIKYDDLTDEEKQHWDGLSWGDEPPPDEVSSSDINARLFNDDTIDKMLMHLMQNGLTVNGGDTLGKTIIFAVNQKHAEFIAQRFNNNYPQYKGKFARVITHATKYAQNLIDSFSIKELPEPQIAISVDMLDTGIDVPEVLNLVFFKAVRSKVKFLQMIGRGTRLCRDLFAPQQDKAEFYIFDYCGNFEYFNENPQGAKAALQEPLGKRLFKARLSVLSLLRAPDATLPADPVQQAAVQQLANSLTDSLHHEVASMNQANFIVRTELKHVEHFARRESWDTLDETEIGDLRAHVAGLPSELPGEHITAKLFDLLCYNTQIAILQKSRELAAYRKKLQEIAAQLETKQNIPGVAKHIVLISSIQTDEFWQDVTVPELEQVRRSLRDLIRLIEIQSSAIVYTMLKDTLGEMQAVDLPDIQTGVNMVQYRKKVESFIRANENHIAIAKLKRGLQLTPTDLNELERFVFEASEVESRERFLECFGADKSLPVFIRSLVGLDRAAVQAVFSQYLQGSTYNERQIRFMDMVIDHLTKNGVLQAHQLYEPPFNQIHYEGIDGVFKEAEADNIVQMIKQINDSAVA